MPLAHSHSLSTSLNHALFFLSQTTGCKPKETLPGTDLEAGARNKQIQNTRGGVPEVIPWLHLDRFSFIDISGWLWGSLNRKTPAYSPQRQILSECTRNEANHWFYLFFYTSQLTGQPTQNFKVFIYEYIHELTFCLGDIMKDSVKHLQPTQVCSRQADCAPMTLDLGHRVGKVDFNVV